MGTTMRACLLPLLLAAAAGAAPPSREDVARAHELLGALAKHHETLATLSATYEQERKTELSPEPLRSSGRFFYSRKAKCLVFHGRKPRTVQLRLDETSYQVYRPDAKKAERFVFPGFSPGRLLLAVFTPAVKDLRETHTVVAYAEDEGVVTIALAPKAEELRAHVARFQVKTRVADRTLLEVSYVRADGESVRIAFADVAINPALDAALFAKTLPKGTDLRVTEVKE